MKYQVEKLRNGRYEIKCLLCVRGDSLVINASNKEDGIKLMDEHQQKIHKGDNGV